MGEIIMHQNSVELNLNSINPLTFVTKAEHVQELLSLDRIDISVQSSAPIVFHIGAYVEHEGRRFTLNLNPKVNKQSESSFQYDLIFEGVQYDLLRKVYFNYDALGNYTSADFPLTGTLEVFLTALLNNANRDKKPSDFNWLLGVFPDDTEAKTITFNNINSLGALQTICKDFELEFDIVQDITAKTNTIHIRKIGSVLPFNFEYGYKNGLYSLVRERVSDAQITTRLYPYGSSENIPTNYRNFSPRLRLPESFGKDYIQDDAKVAIYGLNEEVVNYDDIKPTFKGIVSNVANTINTNNTFDIVIGNIDFDLNEKKPDGSTKYLIAGTPAKIHVNKGNLAGYDFEIHKYVHATKTLSVKLFADERGQKFPDLATVFKFAIGDEITLIDIIMPQSYIDVAEGKLKDKALEDYTKKSQNNVKYSLDIDPMYFVDLGFTEYNKILGIGDYLKVKDAQLNIDKESRIISLRRDLLNLFKYSVDISDTYEIGIVTQIVTDIKTINSQIKTQNQVNTQAMLSGYRNMLELKGMVFDTDGNFDMSHFAAGSIDTSLLSVGAKSQQLTLKDVIFTPNKDGNVNNISISAGSLIHFSISDTGVKTWTLSALNMTNLLSSQSYYIYARVSRNGSTGTFVVTTEQRKFDQEANFYNFLLGVLFTPQNNVRLIHLNYGATYINGRMITTGRIVSIDGLTWFDLDTGEFRGKFIFTDGTNVQTAVNNANNAAVQAQATATNAIGQINDIGNDNKLTANEKQVLVNEWNRIKAEYSQNSNIAQNLLLPVINYQNAYNSLNAYITPLLANLSITSDIIGNTFRLNFQNYYNQNVLIVTAIENKKIENIKIGGRNTFKRSTAIDTDGVLTRLGADFNIIGKSSGNSKLRLKNVINTDGEWTISGFVKNNFGENLSFKIADFSSPYQSFSFVGDKKEHYFEFTFNVQGATSSLNFIEIVDVLNSEYIFSKIKIEKGNKATDWTPAPEDVQTQIDANTSNTALALAQANNALNTANNVASITSFLQTTAVGNVVATGTLLVGDVLGANAMICGVTDRPNGESIRFAAGRPYGQKYNSPFQVLDNGMIRFVNPINGKKTFELGYNQNTGKVVFDIYNENGVLIATIGQNGIEFIGYIPESYESQIMKKMTSNFNDDNGLISELKNSMKYTQLNQANPPTQDNDWVYYKAEMIGIEYFKYLSGKNFETAANNQYEGYYPGKNKLGDPIPNGTYSFYEKINVIKGNLDPTRPQPIPIDDFNKTYYNGNYQLTFQVHEIFNGKIIKSKTVLLDWFVGF